MSRSPALAPAPSSRRTLWPSPASSSSDSSPSGSPLSASASAPRGDGAAHASPAAPGVSASARSSHRSRRSASALPAPPDVLAEAASSAPRSAALLLMSVPSVLRGLPGLSPEQRQRYPRQATAYLRWLSWQNRRPDATSLNAYMQREQRNGASADDLTAAREALSFLHDIVLRIPSKAPATPVQNAVWRDADVAAVLSQLSGTHRLMARMIFEAKLTPTEAAYVRVGDLQLQTTMGTPGTVIVRDSVGRCDRAVAIPPELADALRVQRARVRTLYRDDREAGHGVAPLPPDVDAHFPVSGDGWEWQFLFPHDQRRLDDQTGREVRDTVGPDHVLATMRAVLHAETRVLPVASTSAA